ncbi:MAG: hypothetical protein ACOCVP_02305 [Wenzhouxiangella sp.]
MNPWRQYIRICARCKWLLCGLGLLASSVAAQSVLDLQAGPGQLGALSWQGLELVRRIGDQDPPQLQVELQGLRLGAALPAANLSLSCAQLVWAPDGVGCRDGRLVAPEQWLRLDGKIDLVITPGPDGGHRVELAHPQLEVTLEGSSERGWVVALERLDLATVAPLFDALLALSSLGGSASGAIEAGADGLKAELDMEGVFFDTPDGRVAGDGLALALDLAAEADEYRLTLRQSAGELLLGSVYLPAPDRPLTLAATLAATAPGALHLRRLRLNDPAGLTLAGSAELVAGDGGWTLQRWVVETLEADLAALWPRWLDGPAAALGFPDVVAEGRVHGAAAGDDEGFSRLDLRVEEVSLRDPQERAGVSTLGGELSGSDRQMRIEFGWDALTLLGLKLGEGQARLHRDEAGLRLLDPVRVPVFDGALVIDGLAVLQAPELDSELVLDARIEPLDLARLTRALGLPELGGQLAGRFPGVTYSDGRLAFTGGIEIDAFSGRIGLEDLVIERLFGSAPALSAQLELDRLDLLEVTGAFGFGRMQGQASGWAHDLRLLNWRPVAMDARVYTHEDAPRRRISQRAVDNLSSLGGGGSAVVSGTILRFFEDFPYQRAGLACRLANNICSMDGVAAHESGGFLIVEGRGLPRLDIVGHRRLVDWPQLMDQLGGMIERGSAQAGDGQGGSAP